MFFILIKKIYNAIIGYSCFYIIFLSSFITWLTKEIFFTVIFGKNIINPQHAGLWVYFITLSVFYGLGILINELYPSDPMPVGPYESSIKNEDEINCTQEAINYYYNARVDELYRDGAHRWNAMKQICANEPNPETKLSMIKVLRPAHEDLRLHLEDKIYVIELVNAVEKEIVMIQNSKNT